MRSLWAHLVYLANSSFPEGGVSRKVLQIVSVVLFVEGLSVVFLFSYMVAALGIASSAIGLLLMALFYRRAERSPGPQVPPGLRLVDTMSRLVGGDYILMMFGVSLIVVVLAYNRLVSTRPELGDVDTVVILLGTVLMSYPFLVGRYRFEISFSLLFVGFVVLFLAVPQILESMTESDGDSAVGNWYVHYMLAAPFSGTLDLLGISSTSLDNTVTIEFNDGSVHTLGISAYCAGLYSFSIFLSAFFAFVLTFERLSTKVLAVILPLGLVTAYVGNLLRMVLIGIVGYYHGLDALRWTHENVGWMVFLCWSGVFWWLILKYIPPRDAATEVD